MVKVNGSVMALGAVVVALSGCATATDLRMQTPDREYTSKRSAKEVAGCVGDRMEVDFPRGVQGRPTSKGYTITKEDSLGMYGATSSIVVDIEDRLGGSLAKVHLASDILGSAKAKVLRTVEDCAR